MSSSSSAWHHLMRFLPLLDVVDPTQSWGHVICNIGDRTTDLMRFLPCNIADRTTDLMRFFPFLTVPT